jgi:glycosyltransferase involved in cell wall biosynthesis
VPLVSVLTATYDRAHTLAHLHESLRAQTLTDFEWVVVDDGSTDETRALVTEWTQRSRFPIRYEWQANSGRHAALNRAVELATGTYCAIIDSDDWYRPDALERMVATWESIPAQERGRFANVEGLCQDAEGHLLGPRFPADVFDSDAFAIVEQHGCIGDTKGMYRRDVLAAFPAPTDLGYVTAALVWHRIARRYRTRFVNEIWAVNGYQPGGMTENERALVQGSPHAWRLYWAEYAAMARGLTIRKRLRAHANYVRHSLRARTGIRRLVDEAPAKRWLAIAVPLGTALSVRDRRGAAEASDHA